MRLGVAELTWLRDLAVEAAEKAGGIVQRHVGAGVEIECKDAGDTRASQVVTVVDRLAQGAILGVLEESVERYGFGLLSEELEADGSRFERDYFWCIDPLDGTLPFTEDRSGYAVSIALVSRRGVAQLGVVWDPRSGVGYDCIRGCGARRRGLAWVPSAERGAGASLSLFCDRSLQLDRRFDELRGLLERGARLRGYGGLEVVCQGGAVMNACWTLERGPACYFKFPRSGNGGGSVWDFAATSCLFEELGCVFGDMEGGRLELNRADSTFLGHRGFCCASEGWIAECIRGFYAGSL